MFSVYFFTTDTIGFHCFYIIYSTEVSGFFISFLISLYYLKIFLTETKSPCLRYELIKVLEIRTSIVFNLSFPSKTILLCFSFFFFIIGLYVLISAVIAQVFNPTAEVVMPTGPQTNEANVEIERQTVTVEARISLHVSLYFSLIKSLRFISSKR